MEWLKCLIKSQARPMLVSMLEESQLQMQFEEIMSVITPQLIPYTVYYSRWKSFAASHLYLHSQKSFTVTSFTSFHSIHMQKFAKKLLWLQSTLQKVWKFFTTNNKQCMYSIVMQFLLYTYFPISPLHMISLNANVII